MYNYTNLTFTELVNKITNSRFWDLPRMVGEALKRLTPQPPKYKVYTALLTQSGTDAPVATVLDNDFNYTPTFAYNGEGSYSLILQDTVFSKITIPTVSQQLDFDRVILIRPEDDNLISINTFSQEIPSDDILSTFFIEVRVYN